jgi:PilZ domain
MAIGKRDDRETTGKKRAERRKFRRLDFHVNASIKHEHWTFTGELLNISNMGAYMVTRGRYEVNDLIELTVSFEHDATKLAITVPCKVARVDSRGVGLLSLRIDANDLLQLRLMFDLYKNNPQRLMEEFCKSLP